MIALSHATQHCFRFIGSRIIDDLEEMRRGTLNFGMVGDVADWKVIELVFGLITGGDGV